MVTQSQVCGSGQVVEWWTHRSDRAVQRNEK
jgi:hypothetical protein